MRIINVLTNNIFDLPKEDAMHLLSASPDIFAKVSKSNKIIKNKKSCSDESVLSRILDE